MVLLISTGFLQGLKNTMRLLHTSDWHIGHALGGHRRYGEHEAFLGWLARVIGEERVDVLVVAGDVFDSAAPTNRAQELYYRFLCRVAAGTCRHVVVVAGNHDSPTFLNAPGELLRVLGIHVVGSAPETAEEGIVTLRARGGAPEMIVCAVPYLREGDVRESGEGETPEDRERNLVDGIRRQYRDALAAAVAKRAALGAEDVPVVATGHLFAAGGGAAADDGARELYAGSLGRVPADAFPPGFSYVALGHLHAPQTVAGNPTRRYSGAPLAMGFGEAAREKSVSVVDFEKNAGDTAAVRVRTLPVPAFQRMERIAGDWESIAARMAELALSGERVWVAVEYTGDALLPDLHARAAECAAGTALVVVKVVNRTLPAAGLSGREEEETLDALDPESVFERCLETHGIAEPDRRELRRTYAELLHALRARDANAE